MTKLLKILGGVQMFIGVAWFVASQITLFYGHAVGFLIAACGLAQFILGGSLIENADSYVEKSKKENEEFVEIE